MKLTNNQSNSGKSDGGPRTKAGKEKTRLNALKHGLYSTLSGSGSKHHRFRDRLYRKHYARLSSKLRPTEVVEEHYVGEAADAEVQTDLVLAFQNRRFEDQAEKPARALNELEVEIIHQRQYIRELDEELLRLKAEKESGLVWTDAGGVRDSFLNGVVQMQAKEDVVLTFKSLTSAHERKAFFYGVVQWEGETLWNHLHSMIERTRNECQAKVEELSAQVESGRHASESKHVSKNMPMLSKEDMEFVLDSINKCNRQFSRAINSLMRYRAAKSGRPQGGDQGAEQPEQPED